MYFKIFAIRGSEITIRRVPLLGRTAPLGPARQSTCSLYLGSRRRHPCRTHESLEYVLHRLIKRIEGALELSL